MLDTKTFSPLSSTIKARCASPQPPPNTTSDRWLTAKLSNLTVAEEVLDSLENAGYAERELVITDDGFVVRWR